MKRTLRVSNHENKKAIVKSYKKRYVRIVFSQQGSLQGPGIEAMFCLKVAFPLRDLLFVSLIREIVE